MLSSSLQTHNTQILCPRSDRSFCCHKVIQRNQLNLKICPLATHCSRVESFIRVLYIPGKAYSVADALSRHVALVTLLATSQSLPTLEEVKSLQWSDQFCTRLIYYFESGDGSNLPSLPFSPDSFLLRDDVLYKFSSVVPEDDSLHHASQLVIPKALVPIILYYVHDSSFAGHLDKDKSFKQAQRSYF